MPKASSFILRAESVQIKPLQRLPTVCTYHKSYCTTPKGGHHIRPTLLPRHMLHLILINFADNLAHLCFFQFKSAFEQIWIRNLDWVVALNLCLHATELHCQTEVYVIIFRSHLTHKTSGADHQNLKNQFAHLLHIYNPWDLQSDLSQFTTPMTESYCPSKHQWLPQWLLTTFLQQQQLQRRL